MIQPGMSASGRRPAAMPLHATMLCFITTDAAVEANALRSCLEEAVAQSFNRITVDGDMSTNDTVIILANGAAENPLVRGNNLLSHMGQKVVLRLWKHKHEIAASGSFENRKHRG